MRMNKILYRYTIFNLYGFLVLINLIGGFFYDRDCNCWLRFEWWKLAFIALSYYNKLLYSKVIWQIDCIQTITAFKGYCCQVDKMLHILSLSFTHLNVLSWNPAGNTFVFVLGFHMLVSWWNRNEQCVTMCVLIALVEEPNISMCINIKLLRSAQLWVGM